MTKEIFLHKGVIGSGVIRTQSEVLVEIESRHTAEVETLLLMESDQFPVKRERRFACGKTQHGRRLLFHESGDKPSSISARGSAAPLNNNFHGLSRNLAGEPGDHVRAHTINEANREFRDIERIVPQ
jgi:hypothetical protein